ncbi:MAG: sigma-70 family RNA polymerase sigma factor [Actinomycetota bacterium]
MSTATMTTLPRPAAPVEPSGSSPDTVPQRLAAGDESVIVELYRTFGGRVLGLALRVLADRQLAEEAVQETFVRVWRRAETFDPTREIEPWLFRIARNTAYDLARARSARPRSQFGDPEPVLGSAVQVDDRSDPELATETLELQWEIRAAVDALPELEREVVRLQHLCGLTHREVADRLGISVGTVKSRSHRAHGRLAAALADARSALSA